MSESKLIKAARKSRSDAQAELYRMNRNLWFMIALRYNHNRPDAEDCLQNALVKIFSNLDQFEESKGRFKDWSSRIVVNECLMFIREKQKQRDIHWEPDNQYQPSLEEESEVLSSKKLTKLLQQLPDGYRNVFNLYVIEGYDHKEIAAILDISVGTSKSQLFKARKMLQKHLEVLL